MAAHFAAALVAVGFGGFLWLGDEIIAASQEQKTRQWALLIGRDPPKGDFGWVATLARTTGKVLMALGCLLFVLLAIRWAMSQIVH